MLDHPGRCRAVSRDIRELYFCSTILIISWSVDARPMIEPQTLQTSERPAEKADHELLAHACLDKRLGRSRPPTGQRTYFRQSNIVRALRAAVAAGFEPRGYALRPNGDIVILFANENNEFNQLANIWDMELTL
ncbi:MAG: hypothetical protein ACRCY3_12580 [Sphingorhabdus sp.]